MNLEEIASKISAKELQKLNEHFQNKQRNKIPTYQFSEINFKILRNLVKIEEDINIEIFSTWFENNIKIKEEVDVFLKRLIYLNARLIKNYNEADLKANFIIPLINKINFLLLDKKIRAYYEHKLTYKNERFIFSGKTDFIIAKGLHYRQTPYFFIQEFKKSKTYSDPEPQLLAELISAVELNKTKIIKGAYIIGSIWNFIILKKLAKNKYQYFTSQNFDGSKIEDLRLIYRNLLFVKQEINDLID